MTTAGPPPPGRSSASKSPPNSALSAGADSSSTMNSARMRSTIPAAIDGLRARELGQEHVAHGGTQLAVVQGAVVARLPHNDARSPPVSRLRPTTPFVTPSPSTNAGGCSPLRGLLLTSRNAHPPGRRRSTRPRPSPIRSVPAGRADHPPDRLDPDGRRAAGGEVVPDLRRGATHRVVVEAHEHLGARRRRAAGRPRSAHRGGRSWPLAPTIEPYRKWRSRRGHPPKLRLARKLSQRRTPHEWSRHPHPSISATVTRRATTVPRTRQNTWKLSENTPARSLRPGNVSALARCSVRSSSRAARSRGRSLHRRARTAPLPVVEQALRTGDQSRCIEPLERQLFVVVAEARPASW